MEDKKTWDVLTEINHHPAFNRVYNRPALPPNPNPKSTNSTDGHFEFQVVWRSSQSS